MRFVRPVRFVGRLAAGVALAGLVWLVARTLRLRALATAPLPDRPWPPLPGRDPEG